ncbi:Sec14p-like phosphatidylinositol transfer family protein [Rhynchospora pubera]|uniref:Sec14p-like phosphatidylinositol transfer family protein n=1 Tax=Rhynchospora pubera TaxID=906938 RepID=A0AAV8C737_9POAL|nr:Sec14p-like phosphatidylinositol transfer family protein [Rhynchospora pubera]
MGMEIEKKDTRDRERIEAVLKLVRKQAPLNMKQEKYCNDACVERFLRARGDNVKKAAKHLRLVLSWRESIGIDSLIADEFSGELAEGLAYVAGHDDDARPVVVFRIKQDYPKLQSQKSFVRLLVFTLEVAVSSMSRFVDEFILLFDASLFRSASAFLNFFMGTLKMVGDYYPGRLHKAFVIDPPSMFSVLWKGVRPFVELAAATAVVCSLDYEDSLEGGSDCFSSYPRTASLRYEPAAATPVTGRQQPVVGSASSRFSFTVSHLNSVKPWYLSTNTGPLGHSSRTVVPAESTPSLIGASPVNARSYSFASPGARSTPVKQQTPLQRTPMQAPRQQPRTPKPSFLQSPANLFNFKKEGHLSKGERDKESFLPFLRFYRRPYDEMVYRAKMRPPLGGLTSIVYAQVKTHHQQSHRFTGHLQRI